MGDASWAKVGFVSIPRKAALCQAIRDPRMEVKFSQELCLMQPQMVGCLNCHMSALEGKFLDTNYHLHMDV